MSLRTQKFARRTLGPLTLAVGNGHWWRTGLANEATAGPNTPCCLAGCGQPRWRHWQEVGEWYLPTRVRWARIWRRARRRWTR